MSEKEYREYIESDESIDEILENGEEVEMHVAPPDEREVRITVRLKGEEIQVVDQLADWFGVGRSTAMKIAVRLASKGLVVASPFGLEGRGDDDDDELEELMRMVERSRMEKSDVFDEVEASVLDSVLNAVLRSRKGRQTA